jgi:fucose 4-O-acetylase-like acetyltransferase
MTHIPKNGKRKDELSYLNILFCLLVIFVHVSSNPITTLSKSSWQYAVVFFPWRLSAFVVQGFLFLSGLKLFLNHPNGFNYKSLYSSRLKSILIPYIIWNVIYYIYFVRKCYFGFDLKDLLVYMCNGTLVSPFYFVVILFQFYILAPLWRRMVDSGTPPGDFVGFMYGNHYPFRSESASNIGISEE